MKQIKYPYIPIGKEIKYAPANNSFIIMAEECARKNSLDPAHKTGSVVVKNNLVLGMGANGSNYHLTNGCERKRRNIPTGQGYELCEGCSPKNHSEPRAIQNVLANGHDTAGADLYLYGHWWCCEPCWNSMIAGGIKNVFLLENSEKLFNINHPENILVKS